MHSRRSLTAKKKQMMHREGLRRQTRKWQVRELINSTTRSKTVHLRSNSGSYLTLFTKSTNNGYLGFTLVLVSSVVWGIWPLKNISHSPALTPALSALSFSNVGFLKVFNTASELHAGNFKKKTHLFQKPTQDISKQNKAVWDFYRFEIKYLIQNLF